MVEEQIIRKATCRVDQGGSQLGSSFWVDDQYLVTAAHVVEEVTDNNFTIKTFDGEIIGVEVVASDPGRPETSGSDLAVIKADQTPDQCETLDIEVTVPPIGTEVLWSGYARLFGEKDQTDRQRFGWGNIASETYGNNSGDFFEVDGLFNPSHSGGPVVDVETGNVVGIVSASAGEFTALESSWSDLVGRLTSLFNLRRHGDAMMHWGWEYSDPGEAFQNKRILEDLGLNPEVDTSGENIKLEFRPEEIPIQAGFVQAEISKLLLKTAQSTFQMGVGIASGGEPLQEMLSQF